ncbi:MAG: GatB/YqeY domain-containing protein [Betaproteobacteria bacterium]|nr:GatB/YqeY domain-containing protein [Betaproteobacteria bacterium]
MSLRQRIHDEMKEAMRARDQNRLNCIRMLLAAIKQREVDERITLDDPAVIAVTDKLIRQRRDSVAAFRQARREDLAAREEAEIAVLQAYMPSAASAEEVSERIEAALLEVGASSLADMGKVMALLKPVLAGRADLAAVSQRLRDRLAG